MFTYFETWRSKLGVLMLTMAFVIMVSRLITHDCTEGVLIKSSASNHFLLSTPYGLEWESTVFASPHYEEFAVHSTGGKIPPPISDDPFAHIPTDWRWDWNGFHFAELHIHNDKSDYTMKFHYVPHWVIALPFTLLSTGLLLSKQRHPKTTPKATN